MQLQDTAGFSRESHAAGVVLFREGEPGGAAYLVESGCVEITRAVDGREHRMELMSGHDLFGELALIDGLPRSATARTVVPTVLLRVERAYFEDLLQRSEPMVQHLLRVLLERLRSERARWAGASVPAAATAEPAAARVPTAGAEVAGGALRHLVLTSDLAAAIDADRLELRYQPVVHLATGAITGCEALLRWQHPSLGWIGPDEFIPMAERSRLIHRVGRWVLERALRDWPALRRHCAAVGGQPPVLSVNLSAPECSAPDTARHILERLAARGVAPAELRVELTETAVVDNLEPVAAMAGSLRAAGVGLALDDFGTGYAGLSYLQGLPFTCLKIDREFVRHLQDSDRSRQIVRASIELARPLGLGTVAEGVEDEATGALLAEMGCSHGQGYVYARPLPLQDFPGRPAGDRA
jgi:EAL domain-containing protein (putative c-di-GMP-specific phosphodiesterase class I)/CRP-like cAMP-binding protein